MFACLFVSYSKGIGKAFNFAWFSVVVVGKGRPKSCFLVIKTDKIWKSVLNAIKLFGTFG